MIGEVFITTHHFGPLQKEVKLPKKIVILNAQVVEP
jgi:hypothetical protein